LTKKATIKYTEISLINWGKYQSSDKPNDNPMTIKRQSNDTLQEYKNKEDKNITSVIVRHGNEDINQLIDYFKQTMEIPKEDATQRQSRQYWQLLLRESKTGLDGVKWLINLAKADSLLAPNITSSKDLYYKRIKLITRKRGEKSKFAIMPTGGEDNG